MRIWTQEERYQHLEDYPKEKYEQLKEKVKNAPYRQKFHIQPETGLLNDPNGFCFDGEKYHLFYQWFPLGATHGLKYWRYLTSADLVNFQDCGIGIRPDSPYDSHGAYSGSALKNPKQDNSLLIAYTGNHRSAEWKRVAYQLLATFDTKTMELKRSEPFMSGEPKGYTEHIRDPKIWLEGNDCLAVIGAQRENKTGTVLLVKNGELLGEIDCNLPNFGYMWECPDYFRLDNTDILVFSPQGLEAQEDKYQNIFQSGYIFGDFDKNSLNFNRNSEFKELDLGFDFYAPQTCLGKNGERIMVGWFGLPDTYYPSDEDDWQGCLSLPRVLTVENGQLKQRPWEELKKLRGEKIENPQQLDIGEIKLINEQEKPFNLELFKDTDFATKLIFDGENFIFDREKSGALPYCSLKEVPKGKDGFIRKLKIKVKELRIFLDKSSLEIFINNGDAVMSGRIFRAERAKKIAFNGEAKIIAYPYLV